MVQERGGFPNQTHEKQLLNYIIMCTIAAVYDGGASHLNVCSTSAAGDCLPNQLIMSRTHTTAIQTCGINQLIVCKASISTVASAISPH